jgi:hemerythrin superfamily protein
MTIFDKILAAVTPTETSEDRAEARTAARAMAEPGDWLSLILDHHLKIEAAFSNVQAAANAETRLDAQRKLGVILTGHAIAEESVMYPGLAEVDEKGHAEMGYDEQAMVKVQMAELERLDPMSRDYLDKVEHIRRAVAHHVFEEEGTWFPELKKSAPASDQLKLTQRYTEEFDRYVGTDA